MSRTDVEKQTAIVLATDIQESLRARVEPWGKTFPKSAGVPSNRASGRVPCPLRGCMAGAFNADRPAALLAGDGCRLREGGKVAVPKVRGANNVHQQASTGSDAVHDNLKNTEKKRVFEGRRVTPTGLEPVLPA